MSRPSFSRDELLAAIRVITKILRAFPDGDYVDDGESRAISPAPRRGLPPDGSAITASSLIPGDGAPIEYGYGKDQPQPPRKRYTLAPKLKIDRVDWGGVPRAGQRIARHLAETSGPQISHEIMRQLQIARPTFNNAMSVLQKRKIVVAVSIKRGDGLREADQR